MKNQIFDFRGPPGSGKSTIAIKLLSRFEHTEIIEQTIGRPRVIGYYIPEIKLRILGKYTESTGGADLLNPDEIVSYVTRWASYADSNVFFEGIISAHTFKRYAKLADSLSDVAEYHFCFLDTPPQECQQRLRKRLQASNTAVSNPTSGFHSVARESELIQRVLERLRGATKPYSIKFFSHRGESAYYQLLKELGYESTISS